MSDLVLKQGLLSLFKHKIEGRVLSIVYQSRDEICTVLSSCGVYTFENEQHNSSFSDVDNFQWLLYSDQFNLLVGVKMDSIHLLTSNYCSFFEVKSKEDINCCLFNYCSGDIITAGQGNITCWSFHHGGKTLSISQSITAGLDINDKVNLLHVEDVLGNAQRCFAAVGTSVKVYHLYTGRLLKDATSLHSRSVSAILFFRPLQYLITGARDGSIKVWNSSWELFCSFIGHQGPVTGLSPYTTGPFVISSSLDSTIQLWDLRHSDTIQTLHHEVPVHGIYSEPNHTKVISYSSKQLRIWYINKLYDRTTIIGADCIQLLSTSHPCVPVRLIASCSDAAVRLISSVGGAVLTTALLPLTSTLVSGAYKPLEETLYVLSNDGLVKKFDCSNNPCTELAVWESTDNTTLGSYTCLTLYEVVIDKDELEELFNNDRWLSVVVEAQKGSRTMEDPLLREKRGFYLLFAGTDNGYIAAINQETGLIEYSVKTPCGGCPVSLIACNPKKDYILSATTNQQVIVWRVFPYTRIDALEVMMSFDVIGSPVHMAVLQDTVCVAVNDYDKACYSLTVYSLLDLTCYSSNPVHNHSESITGLDVNKHLSLFVSCGRDSTVRVWSHDNNILRILHLESVPTSVIFSSCYGNISVSMNNNIYTVQHTSYLTETYLKQLVSIIVDPRQLTKETERDFRNDLTELTDCDRRRLFPPNDDFKDEAYRGALSQEELDELDRKAAIKYDTIQLLLAREEDLRNIRDSLFDVEKVPVALTITQRNQAWRKLFPLLQPLPPTSIRLSEIDDFDPDTFGQHIPTPEPYEPYTKGPRYAFFPPLHKFDPPYPIAPDCHLPNSIVLQKLRKSEEDRLLAAGWRPPTLSDRQRKLMEEENERELEEEEEEEDGDSDLMNRLKTAMAAKEPSLSPSPPPSPPTPEPPKKQLRTQMKVEKLIAPKPKPKPPPPPRSPTPPPPPRTPTPPPTPLPEYISQFIGQAWFDTLYPLPNSKTFPKPWSVTRFIYSLLSQLAKPLDPYTKADIIGAIHRLLIQHQLSNMDEVYQALLKLLQQGLTCKSFTERQLIIKIIKLLIHLGGKLDNLLASVFMGLYSEGDTEIQSLIIEYFHSQGLEDPQKYFSRELTIAISGDSLSNLINRSSEWIDSWAEDYLLREKGVKTAKKSSSKANATGKRSQSLPVYSTIDVINYFVHMEHQKELARHKPATPTPPPPEPEEELARNAVVPLPKLEHHGRLTRLGETHCSCCHPERETSLLLAHHHPMVAKQQTNSWIKLSLKTQYLNPLLTPLEVQELMTSRSNARQSLISETRLFLIDHSYPK